jgi:hypothetical protein
MGTPPCFRPDDPPVGWGPSVLTPVFWGYADYNPPELTGAPVATRVYYPSIQGSPECAAFLAGPGRFPLLIFLHGECTEDLPYAKWLRLLETPRGPVLL